MKTIPFLIIVFTIVSSFLIITQFNLNLRESDDRDTFFEQAWMYARHVAGNMVSITGYAIHLDWLPDINKTGEHNDP